MDVCKQIDIKSIQNASILYKTKVLASANFKLTLNNINQKVSKWYISLGVMIPN